MFSNDKQEAKRNAWDSITPALIVRRRGVDIPIRQENNNDDWQFGVEVWKS